ncbi:MAG: tetratricopeptide repeat protein [Acidobacteriota bacterium]
MSVDIVLKNAGRWTRLVICLVGFSASSAFAKVDVKEQLAFGNKAALQDLWNEAKFRWLKVLQVDPGNGAAHNNLGVAFEKEGKMEAAVEEYRKAVKALPGNSYAQKNLQRCQELLKTAQGAKEEKK